MRSGKKRKKNFWKFIALLIAIVAAVVFFAAGCENRDTDNTGNDPQVLSGEEQGLQAPADDTPIIYLTGKSYEIIDANPAPYSDPGFVALDKTDGDITANVVKDCTVNTHRSNYYFVRYSVTDSDGNKYSVVRETYVKPSAPPEAIQPEQKTIYLTFDDGPCVYTPDLLAVLDKYPDVKVTFFVTDAYAVSESLYPEIINRGHEIGVHTKTHEMKKIYASDDAYWADFYFVQQKVKEITGYEPRIMRFPGGSSNTVSCFNPGIMTKLTNEILDMGYQYFDWNVASNDTSSGATTEQIYKNVIGGIGSKHTAVVLQHDIKPKSIAAVESIIKWGLENGYVFRGLDETSPAPHQRLNN